MEVPLLSSGEYVNLKTCGHGDNDDSIQTVAVEIIHTRDTATIDIVADVADPSE